MIEDSINNTNRTQTQADERARELGIQQNGEENWSDAGFPTNTNERVDVSNIYDMVEPLLDGPVYAHYVDGGEIGHMVVVTGVNLFEQTVFVNNPWGFRGEIAFDEFLVGFPGSDENSGYTLLCLWDVDA